MFGAAPVTRDSIEKTIRDSASEFCTPEHLKRTACTFAVVAVASAIFASYISMPILPFVGLTTLVVTAMPFINDAVRKIVVDRKMDIRLAVGANILMGIANLAAIQFGWALLRSTPITPLRVAIFASGALVNLYCGYEKIALFSTPAGAAKA